ncbi:MAG: diguanylate cyclase domain-containing protein [Oceanococcaceae bacterium]
MHRLGRNEDLNQTWVPYRFPPDLEKSFRLDFVQRRTRMVRFGLLLAGLMYLLYVGIRAMGPWDALFAWTTLFRGIIICGMLSVGLLLPRLSLERREQLITLNYVIFAFCLGAIEFITLRYEGDGRYEGMIFIAFHCFLLSGLMFARALALVCTMLGIYLLFAWQGGLPTEELGYQAFFLMLIPALGGVAQFLVENRERESWLRQRELERLAATDSATGLANRAAFEHHVYRALRVAGEQGAGMCLVLVDVDRFKQINDAYGHAAGDQVLQRVARALERLGETGEDVVARWGGDEFIALWHCCRTDLLAQRFENLRLAAHRIHPLARQSEHVTVSCGAVIIEADAEQSFEEFLRIADEQLYIAKNHGRDAWRMCGSAEAA